MKIPNINSNLGAYQWFTTEAAKHGGVEPFIEQITKESCAKVLKTGRIEGALFAGAIMIAVGGSYWIFKKFKPSSTKDVEVNHEEIASQAESAVLGPFRFGKDAIYEECDFSGKQFMIAGRDRDVFLIFLTTDLNHPIYLPLEFLENSSDYLELSE